MHKLLCSLLSIIVATGLGLNGYRYVDRTKYEPMRTDYDRIAADDYTSVFFSTFPIDNFTEYDFEHYRAIYPIKSAYCIPSLKILTDYLTLVQQRGAELDYIYLGVRPDIISAEDILALTQDWRETSFEIIISYPSLEYWNNLDESKYNDTMRSYKTFIATLMTHCKENSWAQDNLSLYFYAGTEWLVGNPTNYESDFNVNAGISHSLSMYSDRLHNYVLTLDNYESILLDFENLVNESRKNAIAGITEYPDLSDWDVVFFGDSITAYRVTSSIPDAFSGLTGAHTYNCAQGGSTATDYLATFPGISIVVDHFINENASAFDSESLIHSGITNYALNADPNRQKCFVINLGMNDFTSGCPLYSDDPYDINTYSGSLRTAIEALQEAYPDAVIILMTPNFTSYFDNGSTAQSENGGTLADYVEVLKTLSATYQLPFYNTYEELDINSTNHTEYLADGCHPNEKTRFLMAGELAKLFQTILDGTE